jgi:ABC-type nitrate/sulfonate/bicarbonate transport system ATPase subunit
MKEILKLENVSLTYQSEIGETQAIKNLSFTVNKGEFVAIIGPSGCGKTTILSLLAGLIQPTSGKIYFNGKEAINHYKNVGYMLQKDELFPWRTIEKNLFLPLEIKRADLPEQRERVLALSEKYGLGQFLKNYPSSLSGGMRQRAALIRTLALDPDVLLLDEPFSALDALTRVDLRNWWLQISCELGIASLIITHDVDEAVSLSSSVLVLKGRPAEGVPSSIVGEVSIPRNVEGDFSLTHEYVDCKRQVLDLLG